jgi:hypothetical protein
MRGDDMAKRVKLTLGLRQAEALLDAGLMGLADMEDEIDAHDHTADKEKHRLADAALTALVQAMEKAKEG